MLDVDLVIRAPRALIDGEVRSASVAVDGGVVVGIGPMAAPWNAADEVTLGDDQVLLPGVVDTHVHVNEPGRTEWEGFASATAAAAAGGVTTIIDMPLNSIPPTTTVEALALKRAVAAQKARVDVGFWGGAIPDSLGGLRLLHDAGVFGFKCFLAPSGVDEFPHLGPAQLRVAMEEIAAFDGRLIVHAEDPGHLHDGIAPGSDPVAFAATRPDSAEVSAIEAVIGGVRDTGVRAHILHLSSAAALPEIRAAKAEGLPLTVETCPHYLTFDAAHIPAGGTQYKCCPPIRDEANREALWEALADGTIDLIASDHSPATADLKLAGHGDFAQAWGGIAGLEVSLSAVWTGASARGHELVDVMRWMSEATAAWAGLDSKGGIAIGKDADLVAFAPDDERVVHATDLHHKNPVTAFDGHVLRGVARVTWLRGTVVHGPGAIEGAAGRLLTRP
ncbi:allantoinase AllB [Demequina capsici]|uniref:allantoinase n=1 Tax=Demequina capsici TaxID=3075620 RepID=A0AA96J8S7_9MICO|nr:MULTISPECIES: allantoinase AllB [unclassified Demequina]WNM23693.1 allantoinase AllB [Demequina sp. OYTSA14]WNM26532.1 allantoinase AllB [Demequina sp. PMTSA13]